MVELPTPPKTRVLQGDPGYDTFFVINHPPVRHLTSSPGPSCPGPVQSADLAKLQTLVRQDEVLSPHGAIRTHAAVQRHQASSAERDRVRPERSPARSREVPVVRRRPVSTLGRGLGNWTMLCMVYHGYWCFLGPADHWAD